MEIKYTFQGLSIYLAMAGYLLAALSAFSLKVKLSKIFYLFGAILAAAAFIYRWLDVSHVPLQNLFELFIALGMIIYPLSIFSRRFLHESPPFSGAVDMLIGFIVLFPAGFVFKADLQHLPPALQSWLFTPHVAAYMLAYIFMVKAALQAVCQLSQKNPFDVTHEQIAYDLVCVGFPLLTAGLILGCYWGKLAWGDYWSWDPKELWSLASWLVYVGYFHFRYVFVRRLVRVNSIWLVAGIIVIVITLLWVNLSRLFPGLHSYAT